MFPTYTPSHGTWPKNVATLSERRSNQLSRKPRGSTHGMATSIIDRTLPWSFPAARSSDPPPNAISLMKSYLSPDRQGQHTPIRGREPRKYRAPETHAKKLNQSPMFTTPKFSSSLSTS